MTKNTLYDHMLAMLCNIILNEDDTSMKVSGKYFSLQQYISFQICFLLLTTMSFSWTNTMYMEFYREIAIGI
jgi:hypothetical protein